jgi:hypothetical protein
MARSTATPAGAVSGSTEARPAKPRSNARPRTSAMVWGPASFHARMSPTRNSKSVDQRPARRRARRPDSLAPQRWAPTSSSGRSDAPGTRSASLASFSAIRTLSSATALTRASTSRRRRCRSWRSPSGAHAIGALPPPSALVSAAGPSAPSAAVPVKASTSVSTLPVPFLRATSTALQLQPSTVARRSPLDADQRRPELRRLNAARRAALATAFTP